MCRYKDGQEVTTDVHIKISRDSQSLENYYLTVTLVKGADAGNYEAHAENSMGTATTKSTVKVNSEYTCIFFLYSSQWSFSLVILCSDMGLSHSVVLVIFCTAFSDDLISSPLSNDKMKARKHIMLCYILPVILRLYEVGRKMYLKNVVECKNVP
jgi:hypothetical protein